jgi:transcriptional regulator with XRE-family HTH domain
MPNHSQHKWHRALQMATITAGQCRAARALLGWSQRDLEVRAKVSRKAIADFEREASTPYPRTTRDIVETLEAAGIVFQAPQEGVMGAGVALKWGVEPKVDVSLGKEARGATGGGIDACAWDDGFPQETMDNDLPPITDEMREEMREYLKTADVSAFGRTVLTKDFGLQL